MRAAYLFIAVHHPMQFLHGLIFGVVIAVLSYRIRFLTASGAVATFLLAVIIYGIGGWLWTMPILVFFVASSLLSHVGGQRKRVYEELYEKTGRRDAGQVAANGGIAAVCVLVWYLFPSMVVYMGYIGAVAAVTADTWGTELGTLGTGNPRSIVTLKEVEKGTSGGVSLAGLSGGALGAACIAGSALLFSEARAIGSLVPVTVAAGVIGSLTDSLLGATLQAQYRCTTCGNVTERAHHCSSPTQLIQGVAWMNNDRVNLACAAAGGAAAIILSR